MTADIKEQESKRARATVAQYHLLLSRRNHFELLGVLRDASQESIREAFKDLAKRWHSDAFAHVDLGPEKKKLDEIFQRLNEAYETLTDPGLRDEYLVFLDRSARGLSTDVHGILRAEAIVDEALMDMRRRNWSGAVDKLTEARQLNPDDPLYDVHFAWARYNAAPNKDAAAPVAIEMLKAAAKRQDHLALAYQYLGKVHFARDNYDEAKKWLKLCLNYDPSDVDAQRVLRLINTRAQKQKQGGLMSAINRFLGKKK